MLSHPNHNQSDAINKLNSAACYFIHLLKDLTMICLFTGTICNYDILPTTTSQLALRYYCVPKSQCNLNRQRSPIMPQSWRLCNEYITPPQADDALICCHNADIDDTNTVHWDHNNVYLPGLRSWLSKSLGQHSYNRN